MREGLGQKYGAPRRNAQERIRSQAAWSDGAAAAIAADVDALEALADAAPGAPVAAAGGGTTTLVSARVRALLVVLRNAMDARARFLGVRRSACAPPPAAAARSRTAVPRAQALRPDRRPVDLSPVSAEDDPGPTGVSAPAPVLSDAERAAAARDAARTFSSELRDTAEACRVETRKLFAAEGKPLPEGEAGLPASLKAFVAHELEAGEATRLVRAGGRGGGARGSVTVRRACPQESCRALREQVDRLQDILLDAPSAALADVAARGAAAAASAEASAMARYASETRAYDDVREAHKAALAPQLADPNRAAELAALSTASASRTADVRTLIDATLSALLTAHADAGAASLRRIAHNAAVLLRLCDTQLMRRDLVALPGDEEEVPERMNLKRLRKTARREAAAGGVAAAASDLGEPDQSALPFAKVLQHRVWAPMPAGELVLPTKPSWALERAAAAEALSPRAVAEVAATKGGKGAAAAPAGKGGAAAAAGKPAAAAAPAKGAAKGGAAPAAAGAPGADATFAEVKSLYTSATRHVIVARDAGYASALAAFREATTGVVARADAAWAAEATWEARWARLVSSLTSSSTA